MNKLQIIKQENFGAICCDFYDNNGDVLMTRKQIGEALGYSDPQKAIDNIHERYRDRLEKFSVTLTLRGADGKFYDTCLYQMKGVYEICRRSQQPKADEFYDWVYEVIESIHKTGRYSIIPQTLAQALRLAADQAEQIEQQQKLLIEQQPKAEFYDAVAGSSDAIAIGEAARVLNAGIGQNRLFKFLREQHVLMENNLPYQEYCDRGYFRVVEQKYTKPNGDVCVSFKTLVYQRGLDYIRKLLAKRNAA